MNTRSIDRFSITHLLKFCNYSASGWRPLGQHFLHLVRHTLMTTKPSRTELDQLDKSALIDLILQLLAKIEQLEDRAPTPPTTSTNSSQPPSRDQKPTQRTPRGKVKQGPQFGHPGTTRSWLDTPDQIVPQRVAQCAGCGCDLATQPQVVEQRHQLVELPPTLAQVIEVHRYSCTCPACGTHNLAEAPAGLEPELRSGARLHSVIAYLKQLQHLSYERLEQLLTEIFGVAISPGALDTCLQRVGQALLPAARAIHAQVAAAPVIHGDETGSRIAGAKAWHWVFATPDAVLHQLSRSCQSSPVNTQ